jgi:hypothetical protein
MLDRCIEIRDGPTIQPSPHHAFILRREVAATPHILG